MVEHLNHLVPLIRRKETANQVTCHVIRRENLYCSLVFSAYLNLRFSSRDIPCPWLYNTPSRVNKSSIVGIVVVWQDLSNVNRTSVWLSACHWTKTIPYNFDQHNPKIIKLPLQITHGYTRHLKYSFWVIPKWKNLINKEDRKHREILQDCFLISASSSLSVFHQNHKKWKKDMHTQCTLATKLNCFQECSPDIKKVQE